MTDSADHPVHRRAAQSARRARARGARFGAGATVDALRAAATPDARRDERRQRSAKTSPGRAPIEAEAAADLGRAFRGVARAGHQRHRRRHPHQPRSRAARGCGRSTASPRSPARYSTLEYDVAAVARGRRDRPRRSAALPRHRRRSRGGREQQRGGDDDRPGGARRRPRGDRLARRAGRDRRRLSRASTSWRSRAPCCAKWGRRTRRGRADYAAAIGDRTALILRVHPSNFRIEGFTERPALDRASSPSAGRSGRARSSEDLGSGHARDPVAGVTRGRRLTAPAATSRRRVLADAGRRCLLLQRRQLLGGPQAGVIVGRAALVDRVRASPADAGAAG